MLDRRFSACSSSVGLTYDSGPAEIFDPFTRTETSLYDRVRLKCGVAVELHDGSILAARNAHADGHYSARGLSYLRAATTVQATVAARAPLSLFVRDLLQERYQFLDPDRLIEPVTFVIVGLFETEMVYANNVAGFI